MSEPWSTIRSRAGPIVVILFLALPALAGCLADPTSGTGPTEPAGSSDQANASLDGRTATGHVHDLWNGRTSVTLIDREVQIEPVVLEPTSGEPLARSVRGNWCGGPAILSHCIGRAILQPPAPEEGQDPTVVPPGTGTVRADVSWSDPTVTGIRLLFVAADDIERELGTVTEPGTMRVDASDVNASWRYLPLRWTDDGHAPRSSWLFVLQAYGNRSSRFEPDIATGTFNVTIRAERAPGPLPLEPPHPDWYAGGSTYRIAQAERSTSEVQAGWISTGDGYLYVEPAHPVPPGTDAVYLAVRVDDDSPMSGTEPLSPRFEVTYALDGWERWGQAERIGRSDGAVVYRIPVEETMTDSLYTCPDQGSGWDFWVRTMPNTVDQRDPVLGSPIGAHHFDGSFNVTVAATERIDASWGELEPVEPEAPGCEVVRQVHGQARPG